MKILTRLFYLLVECDGEVNYRELSIGSKVAEEDGISEEDFDKEIERLKEHDLDQIYHGCIDDLRKVDREIQITYMAWVMTLAVADGYMVNKERELIRGIFKESLHIEYHEVVEKQKEIKKKLGMASF